MIRLDVVTGRAMHVGVVLAFGRTAGPETLRPAAVGTLTDPSYAGVLGDLEFSGPEYPGPALL
jgi:hypothetical protein